MGGLEGLGAIQRMLESYKQVSKALCGKENASLEELLAVVEQVKTRFAEVERERDAAVDDLTNAALEGMVCTGCKHSTGLDDCCEEDDFDCTECQAPCMCRTCKVNSNYEWRGITQ